MQVFKKIISIILRISISVILLVFLFEHVGIDTKGVFRILRSANIPFLLLAFATFFACYILGVLRWDMLLEGARLHIPLKRVIISFAGGVFFSLFMPSTIGGDMVRSIDLAAHTKRPSEVVATVLLDRLSGYVGLAIVALCAVFFGWRFIEDKSTLFSLIAIVVVLILVLFVLFNKSLYSRINKFLGSGVPSANRQAKGGGIKIKESIKNLHHEIHIFRNQKHLIGNNLLLSLLIQVISPVTFYIIALSLGVKINLVCFFIFIPIISAITLLPISIGGLGLRDAATVFFFAKAGVSKDLALAMSLLNFMFILVCAAMGGIIYVLTVHHRRLQRHTSPAV